MPHFKQHHQALATDSEPQPEQLGNAVCDVAGEASEPLALGNVVSGCQHQAFQLLSTGGHHRHGNESAQARHGKPPQLRRPRPNSCCRCGWPGRDWNSCCHRAGRFGFCLPGTETGPRKPATASRRGCAGRDWNNCCHTIPPILLACTATQTKI